MEQQPIQGVTIESARREQADFIQKVFGWMCTGLTITGVTAYTISVTPDLSSIFVGQIFVFYGLVLLQLLAVVYLARAIQNISSQQAGIIFLLYSFFNGLTFSIFFLMYDITSIGRVFFITAGVFGFMALYGYFTKRDLTTVGHMAFFGLVGIIIASIVNMFAQSTQADLIISYIAVIVFIILTAYDMQKIKSLNIIGNADTDLEKKEAIMGALVLYLDFINLFVRLLRIFGSRRR